MEAGACSRCDRVTAPESLALGACCGASLCPDCLGPDLLGWCRDCLEIAAIAPSQRRRTAMILATAYVPRRWQMKHVNLIRVGRSHAEVVTEIQHDRLIVPIRVLAGAAFHLEAMQARKGVTA